VSVMAKMMEKIILASEFSPGTERLWQQIHQNRKKIAEILAQQADSAEDFDRVVLLSLKDFLRAPKNTVPLETKKTVLQDRGGLIFEVLAVRDGCELDDLAKNIFKNSEGNLNPKNIFSRERSFFRQFFDKNAGEIPDAQKKKLVKFFLRGGADILEQRDDESSRIRHAFPKLGHLLNLSEPRDVVLLQEHQTLLETLKLSGSALGQFCLNGDLKEKLSILQEHKTLLETLTLSGFSLGQFCSYGDLEGKLSILQEHQTLLETLKLSGSALGQFCLNGDLKEKLSILQEHKTLLETLTLSGFSLGQLCLVGDLEGKLRILQEHQTLLETLGVRPAVL